MTFSSLPETRCILPNLLDNANFDKQLCRDYNRIKSDPAGGTFEPLAR
jgi:hypothetical protein